MSTVRIVSGVVVRKRKREECPDAVETSNNGKALLSLVKDDICSGASLVDPVWETLDPTPDVHALFLLYNDMFFKGALAGCEVKWSPRMTSCAGICSYEGRGGLCSIRLSKPLLILRPRKDLVETLLHEMIHAYLFVTVRNRDRDGHGPEFQFHMRRINAQAGTHITIYHNFFAEVANYKQHWWRCEGPCRTRRPYFGWVKRASNRAPGPNDFWWSRHKKECGGKFVKVKEPEGYQDSKKTHVRKESTINHAKNVVESTSFPISSKDVKKANIFTGKGYVLGSQPSYSKEGKFSPRLPKASQSLLDDYLQTPIRNESEKTHSFKFQTDSNQGLRRCKEEESYDDDLAIICHVQSGSSRSETNLVTAINVVCPSCNSNVSESIINTHLDHCLSKS